MLSYKYDNKSAAESCGQIILHRDRYCGDNVTNIAEYARQRHLLEPKEVFYEKLLEDLKKKKTDASFIGIWQWHSSHNIGGKSKVRPFFNEEVAIYKGSDGSQCYAQSSYFLLEDTGMMDATKRPIYKDLITGDVFCFGYTPGTPSTFASLWTESPL